MGEATSATDEAEVEYTVTVTRQQAAYIEAAARQAMCLGPDGGDGWELLQFLAESAAEGAERGRGCTEGDFLYTLAGVADDVEPTEDDFEPRVES